MTGVSLELPGGLNEPGEDEAANEQTFIGAVGECIWTFFSDCSQQTVTDSWRTFTDFGDFAFSYASFFFQLLTFQLPIPAWLNAFIVLPPAVVLVYVGIRLIRGGG